MNYIYYKVIDLNKELCFLIKKRYQILKLNLFHYALLIFLLISIILLQIDADSFL